MDALIRTLYKSDLYEITNFACQCTKCGFSDVEFQNKFSICYIRRGSFLFKISSGDLECFNSRFLLNRPGFTHRVKHYHAQADECLIIGFSAGFYERIQELYRSTLGNFLANEKIHSMVLQSYPETEYLMFRLKHALAAIEVNNLDIEGIVLDLMDKIFLLNEPAQDKVISSKQKQFFLPAVERSREWVQENYSENITMEKLASISNMSVFHFNRVFKQIVQLSPYQYLLNFRIHHASHLLLASEETIADVGWSSGFNSPDHFSYAFKHATGFSPQQFRNKNKQEF
jgi:AraC family transcriptional regulator